MSHGVIHILEKIKIDVEQGETPLVTLGVGERQLQVILKQIAVGQAGQHVVVGLETQSVLGFLALGDVGESGHIAAGQIKRANSFFLAGEQGGDGQPFHIGRAVLAAIPDFSCPATGLQNAAPHVFVKLAIVLAGAEQLARLADGLCLAITCDAREGRVDHDDAVAAIYDHDGFRGAFKEGHGQPAVTFRLCLQLTVAVDGGGCSLPGQDMRQQQAQQAGDGEVGQQMRRQQGLESGTAKFSLGGG